MINKLFKVVMVLTFFSLLSTMALAQLQVRPESKDVYPNDRTSLYPSFVAYITNPSENPITCKLDLDIPDGWYLVQDLEPVTVEPEETEKRFMTLFITVVVPSNALAGVYPLQLSATQTGQPPLVAEFKVNVKQVRGVKIDSISEGERVKGGEEISYSFQIRNTGNVKETFRLDVFSSNKWNAKLAEKTVTVAPNDKEKVDVVLNVPSRVSVMEDVLALKAVSEDGIVTGTVDITTKLIPPPPEKVKGTLTRKVPASISLSGSGSTTKEEYSYWSGLNTGGDLTKGRWFNLRLGVPYIVDEDMEEYYRLDYGHTERWELNLGDINTDLGPLTKWQGRGGRFQTWGKTLSLTLAGARDEDEEERDRYGARLEFGKRTKLGLVYLYSPKESYEEENIYSLQLSRKLTENWDVMGEYAVGDKEKDKAWQLESNLETENTDLNVEYYRIGKDYPLGLVQNEEKTSISGWSYPWDFGASYENWKNVENHFSGKRLGIEKIIGRNPSFRLGYDWEERRDELIEKEEEILTGLNTYRGPFSLYASGRWKKEKPEPDYSFAGYDGRVGIRIGDRLDTWYIHEEDKLEEREKDEVGLNWRLSKVTTATLKSIQSQEKGEKTDRISIDLGFQFSSFYFSIGEEREITNGTEDWKVKFSIGKSFNFPTWVKDKGRIVGYLFVDSNGNGICDNGEGLSGIILTIRAKQAITKHGQFIFPPMRPGHYQLYVELPPGYEPQVDLPVKIRLKEGDTVELIIPVVKVGMVFGEVYYDENKNGKRDDDETGVGNVEIALTGEGISKNTFTNVNGKFFFTLLPGQYKLMINESSLPRRYFAQKAVNIDLVDDVKIELGIERKEREIVITEF